MKTPLTRLLRLRSLIEESSRMELARRTAVASAIERAEEREREDARACRERAAEVILRSGSGTEEQAAELARLREAEWRSANAAGGRAQRIAPLAEAAERRVIAGREEFLERRKERRQVERVLESAAERELVERERHEQRELDDWFGMKQSRRTPGEP